MIPTSYKARLPRHLSYPIRAGGLSDALAGVPQFDALSVSFGAHPFDRASEFAEAVGTGRPYAILEARYVRTPLGLSECAEQAARGLYGPLWALWVYPVPAAAAPAARALLAGRGLPAVRAWLAAPRAPTWHGRSHTCSVEFSTVAV